MFSLCSAKKKSFWQRFTCTARGPKTTTTTTVVSASAASQQPQVLELDYQNIEGSGVTFIQVNDSGEVSTIDGSLLGQDSIAIQITGDDPSTNNEEVLDGSIAIEATEDGHDGKKLVKTVRFLTNLSNGSVYI